MRRPVPKLQNQKKENTIFIYLVFSVRVEDNFQQKNECNVYCVPIYGVDKSAGWNYSSLYSMFLAYGRY